MPARCLVEESAKAKLGLTADSQHACQTFPLE